MPKCGKPIKHRPPSKKNQHLCEREKEQQEADPEPEERRELLEEAKGVSIAGRGAEAHPGPLEEVQEDHPPEAERSPLQIGLT